MCNQLSMNVVNNCFRAVSSSISTLFFPLIPWALQLGVLLWSLAIFLFLYSTGTDVRRIEGMGDGSCTCTGAYKVRLNYNCIYIFYVLQITLGVICKKLCNMTRVCRNHENYPNFGTKGWIHFKI